jgi:hypothetical protein
MIGLGHGACQDEEAAHLPGLLLQRRVREYFRSGKVFRLFFKRFPPLFKSFPASFLNVSRLFLNISRLFLNRLPPLF